MNLRGLALTCPVILSFLAQSTTAARQNTQSSSTTQSSSAGIKKTATGEQSVTGCVARDGEEFVLKTDEGTYAFNTPRDLSPYVGKKVKISGRWKASGVTTTAPIKSSGSPAEQPASPKNTRRRPNHSWATFSCI